MNTIKIEGEKVPVIAHRGLSGLERENTFPAFVAAGNRSYFGIETDIHVAADGNFVVLHDNTTERVSGGADNTDVEKAAYDELSGIVLPDIDGNTGRNDIRIPLLRDYISICKKYEKLCVLELKNEFSESDIVRLVDEIKELGYLENMIFISFCAENCIRLRRLLPEASIQLLGSTKFAEDPEGFIELARENRFDLDLKYTLVTRGLIERIHSLGMKINCWTCDDKKAAEELIGMGVDFITTNILE